MGGGCPLVEIHVFNIILDPATGLFLSILKMCSIKGSFDVNLLSRNVLASLLMMEIPATFSKQSSALMLKWPSGNEVTVEMENCKAYNHIFEFLMLIATLSDFKKSVCSSCFTTLAVYPKMMNHVLVEL